GLDRRRRRAGASRRRRRVHRGRPRPPVPAGGARARRVRATPMPMLADDEVRFAGEPVAVVLADDPYLAEDAAELLDIDWTPRPAITGIEAATADGARPLQQELSGNCMVDLTMFESESLPGIIAAAPVIVGGTFTSTRVAALPL